MFKVACMGPMFIQTPINGFKCCVMWVVLAIRVCGSVHSCCLSTVSTCFAIQEHRLDVFLELIPDHYASALLNSHYQQHTRPTLQVMRDCLQAIYRGNYSFPDTYELYAPFPVRNHLLNFVGGLKTPLCINSLHQSSQHKQVASVP